MTNYNIQLGQSLANGNYFVKHYVMENHKDNNRMFNIRLEGVVSYLTYYYALILMKNGRLLPLMLEAWTWVTGKHMAPMPLQYQMETLILNLLESLELLT